jgi:hypothetical protein
MNRSFLRADGAPGGDRQPPRALGGRLFKTTVLAVLSGAVAAAGLMLPADAAVSANHTVVVLKDDSIVEADGFAPEEGVLVEVTRNGVLVGSAQTQADLGGFVNINHDDCWDNFTPQILGGDVVRLTDSAGVVDTARVTDIDVLESPVVTGNSFTIRGVVNGPPPPVGQLQVEARTNDPIRFRPLAPDVVDGVTGTIAYDGVGGEFTATFTNLSEQQVQAAGNFGEFFVSHLRAANEITSASEGTGAPLGGCPPTARHAVTNLSHAVINRSNRTRNLVVSGMTLDATGVTVRLRDARGTIVERQATLTGAAPGPQTWRATFTPFQMRNLNGRITVAGRYASGGATLNGATMALAKDLVSPKPPRASLRPGAYPRRQFITLDAGPGVRIRYTLGNGRQAAPTATSGSLYRGGQIAITASQTLKMRAVDQAGNVSPVVTKRYVIGRGPGAPRIGTASSGAPGGRNTAIAKWRRPGLRAAQVTGYKVTALKLRRNGSVARRISSGQVRASSRRLEMSLPSGRYQFRVKAVGGPSSARSNVVRSR